MSQIGFNIKTLRKIKGLTQEAVCCEILSRSTLSKIENSLMEPSITQLLHIAEILQVDAATLLNPPENPENFIINEESKSGYLEKLFHMENYLTIIETTWPVTFESMYYKGLSYYELEIKDKAISCLSQCENLFLKLDEKDKNIQAENLCTSMNTLRKLKIHDNSAEENIKWLKKILNYVSHYHCEYKAIYPKIINSMAVHYLLSEDYVTASKLIEEYLNTRKECCFLKPSALLHLNMSIAKFSMKDYKSSLAHIKKAIFFFDYIHDKYQSDECYLLFFNNLLYLKDFHETFKLVEFLKENMAGSIFYNTFRLLEAILFYNLGDMDKTSHILQSLNLSALREKSMTDYYLLHGWVSFHYKDYAKCEADFEKCTNTLREEKRYLDLAMIYKDLYGIYGSDEYNIGYNKYFLLHNSREFNSLSPNITVI